MGKNPEKPRFSFSQKQEIQEHIYFEKNKGNKVDRDFVEKRSFTSEVINKVYHRKQRNGKKFQRFLPRNQHLVKGIDRY